MSETVAQKTITHVSDTATWVAHYRAIESERPDALFKDPLAKKLVGERGVQIDQIMKSTARFARFSVLIRTVVIDEMIQRYVREGIDTVLNLGAGLDTRPYRLDLPASVKWIEVDYPHSIEHKNTVLKNETPRIQLERAKLDLADREKRKLLFARIASESKNVLVLTEGVLPYLTQEHVAELAEDLHEEKSFRFWIGEYLAPQTYRHINSPQRRRELKNAPFQFFPPDWFGFFKAHGWEKIEIKFLGEEAARLGRKMPAPWWATLLRPFMPPSVGRMVRRMSGYVVFKPV